MGSPLLAAERSALEFLDEATQGATKLRQPLRIEVVRPLTEEDLADDFSPEPIRLRETKASHHHLAKLLAEGRDHVEISRITGYSPGYIGRIKNDPSLRELVLHYSEVEELAATDYLGALRAAGMDALDELRKRLEAEPERLSFGQLQDAVKLLLVEPMKASAGVGVAMPQVRISFVASGTPQAREVEEGRLIEGDLG